MWIQSKKQSRELIYPWSDGQSCGCQGVTTRNTCSCRGNFRNWGRSSQPQMTWSQKSSGVFFMNLVSSQMSRNLRLRRRVIRMRARTRVQAIKSLLSLICGAGDCAAESQSIAAEHSALQDLQKIRGGAIYPVGNGSYTPLSIQNNGTYDEISVRVQNQLYTGGTTGNIVTTDAINRSWIIEENVIGGSNLDVTFSWNDTEE